MTVPIFGKSTSAVRWFFIVRFGWDVVCIWHGYMSFGRLIRQVRYKLSSGTSRTTLKSASSVSFCQTVCHRLFMESSSSGSDSSSSVRGTTEDLLASVLQDWGGTQNVIGLSTSWATLTHLPGVLESSGNWAAGSTYQAHWYQSNICWSITFNCLHQYTPLQCQDIRGHELQCSRYPFVTDPTSASSVHVHAMLPV